MPYASSMSVKDVATCLNAANLWIETWRNEGVPEKGKMKKIFLKEVRSSLHQAASHMFGKNQPPIRKDLEEVIDQTKTIDECIFASHRFMEVFCYFITHSQDNYIAVHKEEYKLWRREEDIIREEDPTDFIFI